MKEKDKNHCHQCRNQTLASTKDGMYAVCIIASCKNYGLPQITEEKMWKFTAGLALEVCPDCGGKLKKAICKDCAF